MRRTIHALLVATGVLVAVGLAFREPTPNGNRATAVSEPTYARDRRADSVRRRYFRDLDVLDGTLDALERSASQSASDAQIAFRRSRTTYKTVELLAEYYSPGTARALNGPVLDRAEEEAPSVILRPTGFQVVEEALFPVPQSDWRSVVATQARIARANVKRMRQLAAETEPTDGHIFEAARLEIGRVITLGLAGFDAPLSGDAVHEAAAATRGVRRAIASYAGTLPNDRRAVWDSASARLIRTAEYLDDHPDFERLDRLELIVAYANPAARAVDSLRAALGIELPPGRSAWSRDAATLFDAGAFDATGFAPAFAPRRSETLVGLGRDLFFEPALSGTGTRSCASCHRPSMAFTDGLARRASLSGARDRGRNTPTVINVGLQPGSFYDQRTAYLEDQITDVMGNAQEMGHSVDAAAVRLRSKRSYSARFRTAFDIADDSALSPARLRMALAAYLRSLQALDSRFDRATRGDTALLSPSERRGFTLFMGKARCGTCHFAPLFNGATPPTYTEAEPEVIGTPAGRPGTRDSARIDPDVGRFAVDRVGLHRFAFKTPTLRNVALTAPYMHNGVFRTLEEVLDFYDGGGGAGRGIEAPQQTLPSDSLHLSRDEKRDIIAFLGTLTDTVGTTRP
jgi:cytochrome c peroxidase